MMNSSHLIGPMKHFVKGLEEQKTSSVKSHDSQSTPRAAFVSGTHVKQFYEKVVGKEASERLQKISLENKCKSVAKNERKNTAKVSFNINTLMKAVETGNVKDVETVLEDYKDRVDSTDQFGWTPMMSACCAGDKAMVELLLKWNPDLRARDKRGNTCRDLAFTRGHTHVVGIIDKYIQELNKSKRTCRSTTRHSSSCVSEQLQSIPFYCKTCKQNIENTSLKKHLSSTIHNFNAASKRKMPTMYGIPESNKGFQILLRSGWDKEAGLGPSGDGHKFPPKTILKQDRTGLGAKRYKPRVTHTLEDARREAKPKETFKRQLKSQKSKEQRLERALRQMLS